MQNVQYTTSEKISLIESNNYAVRVSKDSVKDGRTVSTTKTSYAYQAGVKSSVDTAFDAVVKDLLLTANPAGSGGGAYSGGDGVDITGAVISVDLKAADVGLEFTGGKLNAIFAGSGTTYNSAHSDHNHAGLYYDNWDIYMNGVFKEPVTSSFNLNFVAGDRITLGYAGQALTITADVQAGTTYLAKTINPMYLDGVTFELKFRGSEFEMGDVAHDYELRIKDAGITDAMLIETYLTAATVYTKAELDGGQLDTRYYTETEVNTWRNSVTQTEMGYLHGVSSDIQTQLTARAIIGANPAATRLCTWTNATTIQGEPNLTFDGTTLANTGNQYTQYSTEAGKTDWCLFIKTGDADLAQIFNYDIGTSTHKNMVLGNFGDFLYLDLANTRVGINRNDPAYTFDVNGTGRFTGSLYCNNHIYSGTTYHYFGTDLSRIYHNDTDFYFRNHKHGGRFIFYGENEAGNTKDLFRADPDGAAEFYHAGTKQAETTADGMDFINNVENPSFVDTGFQGDKWQITEDGNATFEDMLIRGGLTVYELIINRIRYQCGGLIIGAGGGKISEVVSGVVGSEQLFFEDPEGNNIIPFTVGAIVMVQDVDLNRTTVVKRVVRQVSALTDVAGKWRIDLTTTAGAPVNVGTFSVGDEMVAVGHVSDTALDSFLYMSAVDSNNPFLRIMDEVNSWARFSLGDDTGLRLQLGNLNGTYGYVAETYGFAAGDPNNEYMTCDPTNGIRFFNDAGTKVAELAGSSFLVGTSGSNRIEFNGATFAIEATTYDLSASNLSITSAIGIEVGSDYWKNDKTFQFGGGFLSGTDSAVDIGGWTVKATSLYTGTEHLGDGFSTSGITLVSDGSFHSPNFYVDTADEIGFRAEKLIKAYKGVSDTVILSHDTGVDTLSTTWVLKKTITLGADLKSGTTLRIKFDLAIDNGAHTAYGTIKRNGGFVGAGQSTSSVAFVTKSQDIAGWGAGDTIELYIRTSNASQQASAQNFRVCGIIAEIVDEVTGTNS